jgi:hypothetical protein
MTDDVAPIDGKSSHCLWHGELKMNLYIIWFLSAQYNCIFIPESLEDFLVFYPLQTTLHLGTSRMVAMFLMDRFNCPSGFRREHFF